MNHKLAVYQRLGMRLAVYMQAGNESTSGLGMRLVVSLVPRHAPVGKIREQGGSGIWAY